MLLIERPYNYNYSKNPIRYVFQLTDLTRAGLYLQVKLLYAEIGSTTFNEVYTFELKPDSNGNVFFYIQNYLDSLVNYVLPNVGTMFTNADDQAKQFYIEYRELTDDNYDPVWNTDENAAVRIVIKGGVEKNKFDRNNIFSNYLQSQKVFLTWQPPKHFVFFNDDIYLTYFSQHAGDDLLLKIVCTDVNGSVDTYLAGFTSSVLHHFNISPSLLLYTAFTAKKNYYFEISILSADQSVTYVNPYRFYMEYRPTYKKMYELIYFNSLGGVDSVTISGETAVTANRDYDDTEGGIQLDWTSPVNSHEDSYTNIKLQRQYKGDIGFLRNRTKKQQEAFIELFASTKIYQLLDSRWIPVIGLQKSADLGTNNDTKQSFPIEWSLSESNEVFTPEDIKFGPGAPSTVCYPITLSSTILPAATVGIQYSESLNIVSGSLPVVNIASANKPSWMTIAFNAGENTIDFSGMPNAAFSGSFNVSITNCTVTNFTILIDVNPADDGGGGDTGTHFGSTAFVSGDELNDNETTSITGQPGELIVVTVDNYVNGNSGSLTFNGTLVTAIGQTFNLTLDGSGSSGNIPAAIAGNSSGPMPSVILGAFKITSASGGSVGTTDTFTISKSFLIAAD